jgi:hypothetical protein
MKRKIIIERGGGRIIASERNVQQEESDPRVLEFLVGER